MNLFLSSTITKAEWHVKNPKGWEALPKNRYEYLKSDKANHHCRHCLWGWVGRKKFRLSSDNTRHRFLRPPPQGYDLFKKADFNQGIPNDFGQYDAAVCCEAMLYLQNPGLFLSSVRNHMVTGGIFIITGPNPIYAGARLNHLIQGFPRSYSHFVQNASPEPHMPWLSLGLFQLWLLLGLNGFKEITVHEVDEKKPKGLWEIPIGLISKIYYRNRLRKSKSENEQRLWSQALSNQVIYGRRLVITAVAA